MIVTELKLGWDWVDAKVRPASESENVKSSFTIYGTKIKIKKN